MIVGYCRQSKSSSTYTEDDCKKMMRGIILDWIITERNITDPIFEVTGSDTGFMYNLNLINFKTVGVEETTRLYLDETILIDTNDIRTYSRFLDLYRYLQLQIPIEYLNNYSESYFNGFSILQGTKYEHTKKQLAHIKQKYPFLWLLEELTIVDRSISEK